MNEGSQQQRIDWGSRARLAFIVFAGIGAFLLIAEHRAHVLPFLPWLLLAACPLMHVFMHRGHGGHGGRKPPSAYAGGAAAPASGVTSDNDAGRTRDRYHHCGEQL